MGACRQAAKPWEVDEAVLTIQQGRQLAKVFMGMGSTDLARWHQESALAAERWLIWNAPCEGQA